MGIFDRTPKLKKTDIEVPEHDQLDVLRHHWLARLLEAGGDLHGAAVAHGYADLADAFNEAKRMHRAYMDSPEWEHRFEMLKAQIREERRFWREIRQMENDELVRIDDDGIDWPTDSELLRGA